MSAAVAERTVAKLNHKGEEAPPLLEVEKFDPETGERIPKGWQREQTHGRDDDEFAIPGPEVVAAALQPQFAPRRRGRYLRPMQLEGRSWADDFGAVRKAIAREAAARNGVTDRSKLPPGGWNDGSRLTRHLRRKV